MQEYIETFRAALKVLSDAALIEIGDIYARYPAHFQIELLAVYEEIKSRK